MQCSKCSGLRSTQVRKALWQALVPCSARYACLLCGRTSLRAVAPAWLHRLAVRGHELPTAICFSARRCLSWLSTTTRTLALEGQHACRTKLPSQPTRERG